MHAMKQSNIDNYHTMYDFKIIDRYHIMNDFVFCVVNHIPGRFPAMQIRKLAETEVAQMYPATIETSATDME
uniref:hypothetical protein n=1 Tax=Salmonella enterica TaxID=28901 RepID=UPI001B357847|nr:hypothetical protein [Salmonella enterica]